MSKYYPDDVPLEETPKKKKRPLFSITELIVMKKKRPLFSITELIVMFLWVILLLFACYQFYENGYNKGQLDLIRFIEMKSAPEQK